MCSPDISPQVHAYIISYLKKEMPNVFGKESKKRELIYRLPEIYVQLQREYQISAGDFPEVKAMQVLGAPITMSGGGCGDGNSLPQSSLAGYRKYKKVSV